MDEQNQNEGLNEEEVEPVKLGKKKTGFICAIVIFCVIIICITIRGCSVTKEVKNPSSSSDATITQEGSSSNSSINVEDTEVKNSEKSSSSTESSSSSSKESTTSKSEGNNSDSTVVEKPVVDSPSKENTNSRESTLKVADSAILGSAVDTTGIISGKTTYLMGTSYLYEVSIVVVTGNNESAICKYYCPKNTFDALSMGDSLSVTYQADSTGNTSISTISK